MHTTHPFDIKLVNYPLSDSLKQVYSITANFVAPELEIYKSLFDKYGAADGSLSLVEVTALIIEGNSPDLLTSIELIEKGYVLNIRVGNAEAVQDFISSVCVAFQDLEQLERYILRINTQDT